MAENDQGPTEPGAAVGETDDDKGVAIQKIYLKDVSFESPESPNIFRGEWDPKMSLNVDTEVRRSEDGRYEVILKVHVEAKQSGKTAFLVEVQQAGLFHLKGFSEEEEQRVVAGFCPAALFPYAREAVASLAAKGGFPTVMLQPINFDSIYRQQKTGGEGIAT